MLQRTNTLKSVTHQDDREKVELFFSCRKLKDLDTFSKSDPKLTLFRKIHGTKDDW